MKKQAILIAAAILMCACGGNNEQKQREVMPVKVKTTTIAVSEATHLRSYSGTIEEESGTALSFSSIGTLKQLYVSEGQVVRQGQLIGVLDDTSVRQQYEATLASKEQALDAEARMKMLHDAGSLPEIRWVEVQTQVRQAIALEKVAKKGLSDTRLYAPVSGYVASKSVNVGQNVAPGVPVVTLMKIDRVKVKISVPEQEIAQIHQGQTLRVEVPAVGSHMYEARIVEKGVSADALSRSYEVKAIIDNPHHELLPGMVCEASLSSVQPSLSTLITLPANIIQIDADNQPFVWTVVDGKAVKQLLTLGENMGDDVIIIRGLQQGDKVIVEGQQKVSTGMKVEES